MTAAVMSVFLTSAGTNTVTSSLQSIADAFPTIAYTSILLVYTLPSLVIIPFSIFAGMMVGSKIKYRTLVIFGLVLFIVGGVAPAFMNDFAAILFSRAVFGIGLGILTPLGNALVLHLFEGQRRANMLGIGTVVMNIGCIALQLLGAYLCVINWHYVFLAHALGIVSLVIALFLLPEPQKEHSETTELILGKKSGIPASVYIQCALFGVGTMCMSPIMANMSTIIQTSHMGNAASVGIVLSVYTAGAMFAGAIFGKIYKAMNWYVIPGGLLMTAIGMGCVNYGNNLIMMTMGIVLAGIGFNFLAPSIMMNFGALISPTKSATAVGILMAFMNLGVFLTAYYIAILTHITGNTSPKFPVFAGMLIFGISAIVFVLINLRSSQVIETSEA